MPSVVADWSFARPDPAAFQAAGYEGAVRYLSGNASKDLSPGERDEIIASGMQVGVVWETHASRFYDGYQAGLKDAELANAQGDYLHMPADRPIYYADDNNDGDIDSKQPYMQGLIDGSQGRREPGVYGSSALLDRFRAMGGKWLWKVETWGPGTICTLQQMPNTKQPEPDGVPHNAYDVNWADGDWGGWPHDAPPEPIEEEEVKAIPQAMLVKDADGGTLWYCRGGVRSRIHPQDQLTPAVLIICGQVVNQNVDQLVYKGDELYNILNQFEVVDGKNDAPATP